MQKVSISLWENAYDSIDHGLEHLEQAIKQDNHYEYKRVVLDFCHAAELLLKEMLYKIDPIYAFDKNDLFKKCRNPLQPTLEELYSCKSLEVQPLCSAINKYIPTFKNDFRANLEVYSQKASKLRNKIQHFCYQATTKEVREILLQLSYQLLCPAFKYLTGNSNESLHTRLSDAFQLETVIAYHEDILKKEGKDYKKGCCFSCGSYDSLFIIYSSSGYPISYECVACSFAQNNISIDDYRICPECSANSLVFSNELDGGVCLWYKCANHKDGGVLTPMEMCTLCSDYKIEDECSCTDDSD